MKVIGSCSTRVPSCNPSPGAHRRAGARVERIRMIGAATLDLAFVAEGAIDACIMMSNKPWDTAAGTLIAREAGAHVTDAHGNPHTHQSASTIATTPAIARQLATVIQSTNKPSAQRAGVNG